MHELDPLRLTTRRERIVGLVIAAVSVAFHLLVVFGGPGLFSVEEPVKPMRMVRVRPLTNMRREEVLPPRPVDVNVGLGSVAEKARKKKDEEEKDKPKPKKEEFKPEPPPKPPPPEPKPEERLNTVISVITDQNQATFVIDGTVSFKGGGTYWEKRDIPPGSYRVAFAPLSGFDTPASQEGSIERGGKLAFVGRYSKMILVTVDVNLPQASFVIRRPDGRELDMRGRRQAQFKGLPTGAYTITFGDVGGYVTPAPYAVTLGKEGLLAFSGVYRSVPPRTAVVIPARPQRQGAEAKAPARPSEPFFDKRVSLVVTSYPETSIERNYGMIAYPERAIGRGNYQEGWCQVYLILNVNDDGRIRNILVERPSEAERSRYEPLIETVKTAVAGWRFDRTRAEVHVDARFFVER